MRIRLNIVEPTLRVASTAPRMVLSWLAREARPNQRMQGTPAAQTSFAPRPPLILGAVGWREGWSFIVRGRTTDNKNIELLKLTSHLRDHIDVERIIGLNADTLRRSDISAALLGHLQMSALDSLAICICKMFESSNRNELNSIPGIIASLARMNLSENQKEQFSVFGRKYGNRCEPVEGRSSLEGTFGLFCGVHSESLDRLKEFRDRIGAHSDSRAAIKSLPSHAEFECFFEFARDFYEIISRSVNNVGPAVIPRKVGHGLVRLIESMGVRPAKFDFDEED